ncbi:hypothetical protein [Streptomyces sp. NPDC051554]|uniref:hypothetical protein n=1 Tax=Streptomyces sp. NPDC051554 TaxID=3365656 RepID=UPI00379E2117
MGNSRRGILAAAGAGVMAAAIDVAGLRSPAGAATRSATGAAPDTALASAPLLGPRTTPITAFATSSDRIDVLAVASDGRIVSTYWSDAGGWAGGWFGISGGVASPGSTVTAVSRVSTHLDLFSVGTDNGVYSAYWDESTGWSGWFGLSSAAFPGGQIGVVNRLPDHLDLFTASGESRDYGLVDTLRWDAADSWLLPWSPVTGPDPPLTVGIGRSSGPCRRPHRMATSARAPGSARRQRGNQRDEFPV